MKRRSFIKVLAAIPFFGAALARKCEPAEEFDYSFEEINCWNVDNVIDKEIVVLFNEDSQEVTVEKKDLYENDHYSPKWNVNGSWNKAQSRIGLISHLAGANHRFDKTYLNTLSTDELQKLHDDDHNSRKRSQQKTFRLFRR